MWTFSNLIILVMVVFSSSETFDIEYNFLRYVKDVYLTQSDDSVCEPPGFITKKLELKLPTMYQLEEARFDSRSLHIQLDFTFQYASQNTKLVTITPNGVLILRNGIGEADFISPSLERNITTDDIKNSTVEYRKTPAYFYVKWNNLTTRGEYGSMVVYNVAIILYKSGEIIVAYDGFHGPIPMVWTRLIYYYNKTLKQYSYYGSWLKPGDISTNSVIYVEQCTPGNDEPTNTISDDNTTTVTPIINFFSNTTVGPTTTFSDGNTTTVTPIINFFSNTTVGPTTTFSDDNTTTVTPIINFFSNTTVGPTTTTSHGNTTAVLPITNIWNAKLVTPTIAPVVENEPIINNSTYPAWEIMDNDQLTKKIIPSYVEDASQACALFDSINQEYTAQIPVTGKTIDFSFKFNDVLFQTITIDRNGRILLNSKSQRSTQLQIEPIPQTVDVIIKSFNLTYRIDNEELIILWKNIKIKTHAVTSDCNAILLVFKKTGTIKIVYANLVNTDIDGKIVILHTFSSLNQIEGEVDFTKIRNGTIVLFGNENIPAVKPVVVSSILTLPESQLSKFEDDIEFAYQKYLATFISKFLFEYNQKSLQNIYAAKNKQLNLNSIERRLQIDTDGVKSSNSNVDFKYSADDVSLTWSRLTLSTKNKKI